MKKLITLSITASLLVLPGAGCLSMQNQATLDGGTGSPYVEAFVAYPGPQDKWAGPAAFVLHVVAREAGLAQVTVSSAFRNQTTSTSTTRHPASASATTTTTTTTTTTGEGQTYRGIQADAARELLGHLADAAAGPQTAFQGCLSPVRVRLIREDGALVEKLGCRGEKGWPRVASETVSQFITAQVEGVRPATAPVAAGFHTEGTPTASHDTPAKHEATAVHPDAAAVHSAAVDKHETAAATVDATAHAIDRAPAAAVASGVEHGTEHVADHAPEHKADAEHETGHAPSNYHDNVINRHP